MDGDNRIIHTNDLVVSIFTKNAMLAAYLPIFLDNYVKILGIYISFLYIIEDFNTIKMYIYFCLYVLIVSLFSELF